MDDKEFAAAVEALKVTCRRCAGRRCGAGCDACGESGRVLPEPAQRLVAAVEALRGELAAVCKDVDRLTPTVERGKGWVGDGVMIHGGAAVLGEWERLRGEAERYRQLAEDACARDGKTVVLVTMGETEVYFSAPQPGREVEIMEGFAHWMKAIDAQAYAARCQELEAENARLKAQIEGHCERIAKQSDLLSRRAERPVEGVPGA